MTPEKQAISTWMSRLPAEYTVLAVYLFGSHSRQEARRDSDLDLAVLMQDPGKPRAEVAMELADLAFDVLLETGVLIDAVPIWEGEWQHPETFSNPALLHNIRQDGIRQ